MSLLRFEYFLVISMAMVLHFHKSPKSVLQEKLSKERLEKCYEGLGCVKLTKEWTHRIHRPVNLLPADRHAINTIFLHWTLRHDNCSAEVIGGSLSGLKSSGIGGNADLKIVIHDFTSNGYTGWIHHLAHALLTSKASSKMSVVSVDWAAGAEPPYVQAVANARLVALEVIIFLEKLKKTFSLQSAQVHIIGHGVGAHTAGYVGKVVRGIRRITALDPSGPYFQGMPPNVKLYRTDAGYVEVVHTDCGWGGQGNKEVTGHVDFFPNGGKRQPGCAHEWTPFGVRSVNRNELKLGQIYRGCSHKRAFKYYIEALTRPACSFVGYTCSTYTNYLMGECLSCGQNMTICASLNPLLEARVDGNKSALYFITASSSPYCVETLEVTIGIQKASDKWHRNIAGYFNVTIWQKGGDVSFVLNEEGSLRKLHEGYRHKYVVRRSTPPVTKIPLKQLSLSWHRDHMPCIWCRHEVLISNITMVKLTNKHERPQTFCGKSSNVVLKPNSSEVFHVCFNVTHKSTTAITSTTVKMPTTSEVTTPTDEDTQD